MAASSDWVGIGIRNLNNSEELTELIQEINDMNAAEDKVVWTIDTSSFLTIICC